MNLSREEGLTLVELIVAMAVIAIVMVGMVGAVFAAGNAYSSWAGKITAAASSSSLENGLQAALMADGHRYVPCSAGATGMAFCLPDHQQVVTYTIEGHGPYRVVRRTSAGASAVVARDLAQSPAFRIADISCGSVESGRIDLTGLTYIGQPTAAPAADVYFESPVPGWGC